MFLFFQQEAGSFKEGTGKRVLDMLHSDPQYSKFVKYCEKLNAWDACKRTVNEGKCCGEAWPWRRIPSHRLVFKFSNLDALLAGWKAKAKKKE